MKKIFIIMGLCFFLNPIKNYAQAIGQSGVGIEFGFNSGSIANTNNYKGGGLFYGAIFKEFMKPQKNNYSLPSFGTELKLVWNSYVQSNDATGNSFSVNVYRVPLLFKVNFGSKWSYVKDEETKKGGFIFRGIYLFAGPEAGYINTNATDIGKINNTYFGGTAGIQIWMNRFKVEVAGHRSFSAITSEANSILAGGSVGFGIEF